MQERKTYKVELTDTQKERLDTLLEFVGSDDYIKLKEVVRDNKIVEEKAFPNVGDVYWQVFSNGRVSSNIYYEDEYASESLNIGNCFKTKEEAEFEAERLKVITEMKKFSEQNCTPWQDGDLIHWYICFDYSRSKVFLSCTTSIRTNNIYFENCEIAKECIKRVGEDRIKKYYLRMDN